MSQKLIKLHFIQQNDLTLFKEFLSILKKLKQLKNVFQIFSTHCKNESESTISFLTHLFFAVMSSAAFYQLCNTCTASQWEEMFRILQSMINIFQTIQTLDQLDIHVFTILILQHYYLTYLAACHDKKEKQLWSDKHEQTLRKLKYEVSTTQAVTIKNSNDDSSSVIKQMMKKIYSNISRDNYLRKSHSLNQWIWLRRHWYILEKQLSEMLTLVSTEEKFDINCSE